MRSTALPRHQKQRWGKIYTVSQIYQIYPKFPMKMNFDGESGVQLKPQNPIWIHPYDKELMCPNY